MLYFLIWKALKSYRYLYIRYFISSGIIIRGKIDLNTRAAAGIAGHGRALLWPLAAKRPGISSSPGVFLLSSVCSHSWVSPLLFKQKLKTAIIEHLHKINARVFRFPRPSFAVPQRFKGVLIR